MEIFREIFQILLVSWTFRKIERYLAKKKPKRKPSIWTHSPVEMVYSE